MKRGTITAGILENSKTLGNIYDDKFENLGKIENSKKKMLYCILLKMLLKSSIVMRCFI